MTETEAKRAIEELRARVDTIDTQILDLLKQRVRLAREMGAIKKNAGCILRDTARENKILRNLALKNSRCEPLLPESDLNSLYVHIMHICLKAQEQD